MARIGQASRLGFLDGRYVIKSGDIMTGGLEISIASGGNQQALYLLQNDTVNNPKTLYAVTTTTAECFRLEQNGALGNNKTCFAVFSNQAHIGSDSYIMKLENANSSSSIPLAYIAQSGNAPALIIESKTTSASNAHVLQMKLESSATQKFIEALTSFATMFTVDNDGTLFANNTIKAGGGYLSSDNTAGLTQASTTTLGKSITVKNGLITAFA